jgi:hypothetical protein
MFPVLLTVFFVPAVLHEDVGPGQPAYLASICAAPGRPYADFGHSGNIFRGIGLLRHFTARRHCVLHSVTQ